jgi:RimJ/RimL family protein N-acetyltransferase
MLLRDATTADLPALLDVQQEGAQVGLAHIFPQDLYPFPRSRLEARWAAELAGDDVVVKVVVRGGGPVEGFAAVRGNELLHFGLALSTWGSGLAAAVHDELVGLLAASGEPSARLRVFEENHRARRFYEKLGWTATSRRTRSTFPPYPVLLEYRRALTAGRASAGGTSS